VALEKGIVVGGQLFPVCHPLTREALSVVTWRGGSGPRAPEFRAGDGYNKPRRSKIDAAVVHWTGGEAEPITMAETLRKRKLGVEWAIGGHGLIHQFCDPALVDTADAGVLNARSVGIEVVCYGYSGGWFWDPVRAIKVPRIPPKGRDRGTYLDELHGRTVRHAMFREAQVSSLLGLCDAIHRALGVPRDVPPTDVVLPDALLRGSEAFKGFVGHYMVTARKRDPGRRSMDDLRGHFSITMPLPLLGPRGVV